MRGKVSDRSVEARLRREAPESPGLSGGFLESLGERLDTAAPGGPVSARPRARPVWAGGAVALAAAAVVVAALVWRPGGRDQTPGDPAGAMGEALLLSAVERPRVLASAVERESGRLGAEREKLLTDARRINSTLLAPLRSVLGAGG